jgi:TRAP-type C4-dicarboxylate transport system substrate-binding protein
MKKIRVISLITVILFTIAISVSWIGFEKSKAQSKAKYVIKLNHVLAPTEPYHQGFLKWAENVKKRTNGAVEIQVFPSAQLGVEEDIIEQIRQGANIAQNTDAARLGMYVPQIAVVNGPYFLDSIDEVQKLKNLSLVKKWLKELEDKFGIKVISFSWVQGFRHMLTNKPITTPKDLKGLRIRTPGAPIWQESIRALGATPVAMNFGDVYMGIQQKAIDGAELTYRNIIGNKLYNNEQKIF